MSEFFVDTSALAKRYIPETGTSWVTGWIEPQAGNVILISALSTVEMISALMRREREGHVTAADRIRLQNDFLYHVQHEYLMIDLDEQVLADARYLLVAYPLRALDALQLASAMYVNRVMAIQPLFISGDDRLLNAAYAEGFVTDNPNAHP